ncbi:Histidine decarboxylase [Operophtera brumata]|uniref:Histidine decarboxylase n=1 Tax=Operophtera brumata TaxID=104452 RepID=A0A0L7L7K8_OPEBR|nr:Histidine decarboxylase [Operophtera brumata]
MVDYIADYLENIRDRRVYPSVQPGYLHKRLPSVAPEAPENWDDIFKDVEEHIMPGVSVYPSVQPGYLHKRLPSVAPEAPENWDDIFKDVEEHIMPGVSVYPSVQPGYLHKRLPSVAPEDPENWDIFKDVEEHIMPGAASTRACSQGTSTSDSRAWPLKRLRTGTTSSRM